MTTPEPPYTIVRSSAELSVDDPRIVWPVMWSPRALSTEPPEPRDRDFFPNGSSHIAWQRGRYVVRLRAPVAVDGFEQYREAMANAAPVAPPEVACTACGHAEYHCPAGGCNGKDADGDWCECQSFAPIDQPAPSPVSPDGGMAKDPSTAGWQGIHDGPKPDPSPGDAVAEPRWRVGRSVGRTIYRDGALVGVMDTRELADEVVAALVAKPTVVGDAVAVRDAFIAEAAFLIRSAQEGTEWHERNLRWLAEYERRIK